MVNYLPISEERFRTILQEKTKNCRHWSKPRLVKISLAMTRLLNYRWLVLQLLGNRLPAWHKSSTVIKNSRLILPCRVSGTLLFQIMGHSTHPKNFSDSAKCGSLSTKPHPLGIHKAMVRQSKAWKLKKICCWKLKQQVKTVMDHCNPVKHWMQAKLREWWVEGPGPFYQWETWAKEKTYNTTTDWQPTKTS